MPKRTNTLRVKRPKSTLDPWTAAKVDVDPSIFWARSFARYEEDRENSLDPFGGYPLRHNIKRFELLLGHIIDFSDRYDPDDFPDLGEWDHILEELEEIEDAFLTIRSILDYSIPLKERFVPNGGTGKKAASFLSEREYSEISAIDFDARHFDLELNRSNIFKALSKIQTTISQKQPIDKDMRDAFTATKSKRTRCRPRAFAKKFIVLALAEYYAEKNEFGKRAYIGFCQEPSESREQFSSDFLTFLHSFLNISEEEYGSKSTAMNGSLLISNGYTREILRKWNNRPRKLRNKKILRLSSMEEIATILSDI